MGNIMGVMFFIEYKTKTDLFWFFLFVMVEDILFVKTELYIFFLY